MSKKFQIGIVLGILTVLLLLGSLWWFVSRTVQYSENGDTPEIITYSTSTPSEVKPDNSFAWKGPASYPKKIQIGSIGVDAYLQNVGIDQHKEVAVPSNIHFAGWFAQSVVPGEKGLSIIDGHVDGPTIGGIFTHLSKVKEGDEVKVVRGDDTVRTFTVQSISSVPIAEAAGVLFSQDPTISSQLSLITCGGTFNDKTQRYDQRVIVVASLNP